MPVPRQGLQTKVVSKILPSRGVQSRRLRSQQVHMMERTSQENEIAWQLVNKDHFAWGAWRVKLCSSVILWQGIQKIWWKGRLMPEEPLSIIRNTTCNDIWKIWKRLGKKKKGKIDKREWGQKIPMVQGWKWKLLSHIWLFATPWTIEFMEFSRPEYWSG